MTVRNRMNVLSLVLVAGLVPVPGAHAQVAATDAASLTAPPAQDQVSPSSGVGVGVGVKASTLGLGVEAAVRLHRRLNARVAMHRFSYSRDFEDTDSGLTYRGTLSLQSVSAYLDLFPFGGGFHISPGMVFANGNEVRLAADVPAGDTVSIDDVDYLSAAGNPIAASGAVTVASARPALVLGWGNLVPRSRRVSVPFELGVVFQGAPTARLDYTGTACAPNGQNCRSIATDPVIQAQIRNEEAQLNDDLSLGALRYFPVLSIGIGFRF